MKRIKSLNFKFVEYIPEALNDGVIYISITFKISIHKCCCGCGKEVVTPLSPTDWEMVFDGRSVSLYPSIGNWGFECRSHYWIRRNKVIWASSMSEEEIQLIRTRDRWAKERYYNDITTAHDNDANEGFALPDVDGYKETLWQKLKKLLPNF